MEPNNDDYDFNINEAYLPYICNGDCTGLNTDEKNLIDAWLEESDISLVEPLYDGEDLDKSFMRCDLEGSYCMAVRVRCFRFVTKMTRI